MVEEPHLNAARLDAAIALQADRLVRLIAAEIDRAEAWTDGDDGVRMERRAKAVTAAARGLNAVQQLLRPPAAPTPNPGANAAAAPNPVKPGDKPNRAARSLKPAPQPEDTDMDDDLAHDPAGLAALRDRLEHRLERIVRQLEQKGAAGESEPSGASGPGPELAAERPSGPAPAADR